MAGRSDKDDERSQGDAADRPQDPFVERLRPDPSEPPTPVMVLEGLLGDSDRSGFRRLYLTRELDHYAEFLADQVLGLDAIPPDSQPFLGQEATRVTLARDATVDYTRSRTARPLDEFDLDIRLGPPGGQQIGPGAGTWEAECPGPTWGDCPTFVTCVSCPDTCQITICRGATCIDVNTCDFELCPTRGRFTCRTCETCRTRCETCRTCVTCDTCAATCNTCPTRCETCETCATCAPTGCGTCGPQCFTQNLTCDTCRRTVCDTCITCTPRCPTAIC